MECDKEKCKSCGEIQTKTLEAFENIDFDIQRVTEYLGWKIIEDGLGKKAISRETFPRTELEEMEVERQGYIVLVLQKSKTKFFCFASLVSPLKMTIHKFQRIRKNKVLKEVKSVVIFDSRHYSLQITDESEGFISLGSAPNLGQEAVR